MSSHDPSWNFLDRAARDNVLRVLRREGDELVRLLSDPGGWHDPTAAEGWAVRDLAGHLVDANETLLDALDMARRGGAVADMVAPGGTAAAYDAAAKAFRAVPRDEVVARLAAAHDRLVSELEALSDDDWSSLEVQDRYAGPYPPAVFAAAWIGGYAVHGWDVRQGRGVRHALAADAADLLVPFVFLLWQVTADTASVQQQFAVGVRTTGRNGGETRLDVAADGIRSVSGSMAGCDAVLDVDPGTLVLIAYGRVNAGAAHGDPGVITRFLSLFPPM